MKTKKSSKDKGFFAKVNEKTYHDFKIKCAKQGVKMNDTIDEIMSAWNKNK